MGRDLDRCRVVTVERVQLNMVCDGVLQSLPHSPYSGYVIKRTKTKPTKCRFSGFLPNSENRITDSFYFTKEDISLRLQLPEVRNVQNSNPDKLDSNSQSAHIVSSLFPLFPSLLSLPPSVFPCCLRLSPHVSLFCLYHLHLKGKISAKAHSKQRKRCVSPLHSSKQDN